MQQCIKFILFLEMTLYMLHTVFLSIIGGSKLYIEQQAFFKQILLSACFDVCWSFDVVGLEWYPCCRLRHSNPTTPKLQHTSNQEQYDQCGIPQNSRKLLMMDILMSETC